MFQKTLSYRWTISDIKKVKLNFQKLKSPSFSLATSRPSKWHLTLQMNEFSPHTICVGLHMDDKSIDHKIVKCRFVLDPESLGIDYYVVNSVCSCGNKFDRGPTYWIGHRIKYRMDLDNKDTLIIRAEADIAFVVDAAYCHNDIPSYSIREGMHSLYKNEELTDMIIKCEDKELKVHKAILASQSPVFRAMFEVDMKEKQSGVTEVSGVTPAAMSDLVTYLYTGIAPNLNTLAGELLDVADKYDLPPLLSMCENELGNKIKETSVIERLILADLHGRTSLKRACLEFVRLNSAQVFQTSEWADFKDQKDQYASLYVEILEHVVRA